MATNPQGAIVSTGLTEYAFSVYPDYQGILAEADFLAPRVVTGGKKGDFSIFDTKQAFLAYEAQRAIGGPRRRIKFAGSTGSYNCKPQALEIGLDDAEVESPDARPKQERAKVRTLLANYANSRFTRVWTVATTSGNYTATAVANAGKFSSANIDPIAVLDDVIVEHTDRCGLPPNRGIIALNNWATLRNHPEAIKRQPGSSNVGITLDQLKGMLCVPVDFRINKTYIGTTGFGSTTDVKAPKIKGYIMLWNASDMPTNEDPSAFKTMQPDDKPFDAVMQYRDNTCGSDIFYIEQQEDVVCASALMATLITVS
jgi:hypothetical protein